MPRNPLCCATEGGPREDFDLPLAPLDAMRLATLISATNAAIRIDPIASSPPSHV
jgi:hypothetical protein